MIARIGARVRPFSRSISASIRTLLLAVLASGGLAATAGVARASGVYYVDNSSASCSNSGPGTEAQPYCTISAAVSARGGPGTTIYVKPGIYREQVSINTSGASGSPFVIQALGGTVTIDGADDFSSTGSWTAYSGNVFLAAGVTWSPVQVLVDTTRLFVSTAAPASLPTKSFTYVAGQGLYVNIGGSNPGTRQTKVGHRAYAFSMYTRSYITIDGFNILRADDRGINMGSSCTNITATHNNASWCWKYGIFASGGSGFLVGANTCSDNQDHGICMISGVTNSTFEDNDCARNARLDIREANGLYLFGAPNNVIRRNRFHNNQDSGLQIQSGSNGNLCYLNRSWNNGDHGYDHLFATDNIHVCDIAYGNYKDGFSIEGTATGQQLYNCIAIENGLTTNEFDLWVDSQSTTGFVSDYNIFWNSTSQTPFKYISTQYNTLSAYQAASGQDAHSIQANPKFVNAPSGDFHLLSGSPAIDSGTSGVPNWPALDADGAARVDDPATANTGVGPVTFSDRGSFEYVTTGTPHAPLVTAPSSVNGAETKLLTVNVTASDPDGDPITSLTATGVPAGATFTPGAGNTGGTLSWTPSLGQAGSYTVTFTASNALSGSATTVLNISQNGAPVVTAPASVNGAETKLLTVNVTASDPDGDPITSLSATGVPPGASFTPGAGNTTGTLSWTPSLGQAGSYTVTFTASNALSGSATTVLTISQNGAPVVTAPASANGTENKPLTVNVTASDPDGDPITSLTATGVPAGATFTPGAGNTSGTLSWTPSLGQAGSYTVTFTASNALSGSATTVLTISQNGAPVVTAPSSANGTENSLLTVNVTASDPDGEPISSLTATGVPAGATFTPGAGNTTGTLSWTPSFTQAGSYTVTFTASNALSGSATTVLNIANNDRAPVVSAPANASGSENNLLTINVSASDPDGDAITSLTATGVPAGATFTPGAGNTTGTLSWTPSFTQAGGYTVTFIATNAKSASSLTSITIANVDRAPVAVAPAAIGVRPGFPLVFRVTASDPDGDAIAALTAAPLPAGASFTPDAGNTSATFSWTPTLAAVGDYNVTFTASNALPGSAVTAITVSTTADQNPVVVAPASVTVRANALLTFGVTATDPDGNAINSLTAAPLPAGASFTPGPGNTAGTFSWTPTTAQQGSYSVSFTASNVLVGWATTGITVRPPNQLPTAVLSVTPATGNEPLLVTANASGSSDPDGGIATYNFNFGDGTVTGPQSGSSAAHTYAAGTWTATVTVTDVDGGTATASQKLIVAPVSGGANLVTNPSFETNTTGWVPLDIASLSRVAGGFDGGWALQVSTTKNQTFGADDSPNTVASTGPAGTRYRCQAWVRSASAVGDMHLRIREFQGTTRVGVGNSATIALSPTWQMLSLDYVAVGSGHSLDLNVMDQPHGSNGPFLVDNVSLRIVTGPAPAMAGGQGAAEESFGQDDPIASRPPLEAVLSPSPLQTHSTLAFRTTQPGPLRVLLYDLGGRRVRTLLDDPESIAGEHRLAVEARGDQGQTLSPGVYFYRVSAVEGAASGRLVIAR